MHEFLRGDPVRDEVNRVLGALEDNIWSHTYESRYLDFKEEAGRRNGRGEILPSNPHNEEAAFALAGEATCMANTEHGGALIVGVADGGDIIGTEMDAAWLRGRIYALTEHQLTVSIQEVHIRGRRLLVILAPQAIEPVPWKDIIHWRVKDQCMAVTEEAWRERQGRSLSFDWSAQDSKIPIYHVRPAALNAARSFLDATGLPNHLDLSRADDEDLLRRLGVVTAQNTFTNAGYLLLIGRGQPDITYRFFAKNHKYSVLPPVYQEGKAPPRASLLEELATVFAHIERATRICVLETELEYAAETGESQYQSLQDVDLATYEKPGRLLTQVPPRAIKEALINGVAHRDWAASAPVDVWHSASSVMVGSIGGFFGGVTAENLGQHPPRSRNNALVQVLVELHLMDYQGGGITTLRREMLKRGMPAPLIEEVADGDAVRVQLTAEGQDVVWACFIRELAPRRLRRDLDLLILLHHIVIHGYVTLCTAQELTAKPERQCLNALASLEKSHLEGEPAVFANPCRLGTGDTLWELTDTAVKKLNSLRDRYAFSHQKP
ncbi:RNA-binding domain-containing protein [Rothia endophytica]|uniref:ATP-binding protein n=1 Tax=Rothia endophytica TaxID=1324766 RepID=A0ABP9BMH2_9MICC